MAPLNKGSLKDARHSIAEPPATRGGQAALKDARHSIAEPPATRGGQAGLKDARHSKAAPLAARGDRADLSGVRALSGRLRRARVQRRTRETDITVLLDLDGQGDAEADTGIGFLDHMLAAFAKHGRFDLQVSARGDLHVDAHHTVEDVGLVLGQALAQALGDKAGITRFGHAYVPLDEALARCVIDLSGRPYVHYAVEFRARQLGTMSTELFEDFFRALADQGRFTLHLDLLRGRNAHHIAEALFKSAGRALSAAVALDPRVQGVPSTKGVL